MRKQIYSFNTKESPLLTEVGGKAQSLISTTQAGLPVPGGITLSVAFFAVWTDKIKTTAEWKSLLENPVKENCDAVKTLAEKLNLEEDQKSQLDKAMAELEGNEVFAVRSSSPEEDLAGSSFAGMYETFLGTIRDQLEETIAKAYSSMFDYRVMEYKAKNNISLEGTCISVIVQKQIASDISGVGFSLNPLNNCFDEAVINASFGLGEAIVSGIVTPDTYIVEKVTMEVLEKTVAEKKIALHLKPDGGIEEKPNSNPKDQALTQKQILELTGLIKKTEDHYGFPVDTEWAYEKEQLYLLQARPVTSYFPLFPEMMSKPGERKRLYMDLIALTQGFDECLSVLGSDIWYMVMDYMKEGTMPDGEEGILLNISGRQYIQMHNIFKSMGKRAGRALLNQYDNAFKGKEAEAYTEFVSEKMSPLLKQGKKAQNKLIASVIPFLLKTLLKPAKGAAEMNAIAEDLTIKFKNTKNDKPYDELVNSSFELFRNLVSRMAVYYAGLLSNSKIKKMMKNTEAEDQTDALLMDLAANPTSAMGRAMFDLASFREIQETANAEEFVQKIHKRSYSSEFLTAWDDYVDKYGARGFKEIDVASPRLEEKLDEFFLQLKAINLKDNVIIQVADRKLKAITKMRAVAEKKGKLKAFNKALNVINMTYGLRETPKFLLIIMNGALRKVVLEIADEFVSEDRLQQRDQIFNLHKEQIAQAQRDKSLKLLPLIEKNLEPYKLMENVRQFPNFIDSRGKIYRNVLKAKEGNLAGMAVSNGIVRGKAKVLASPYEKPLEPGEILVTVATEPAWTPVFSNASGVVLEIGGGLQHGAIIAREYGLPCVSGLPGVTKIIKDGDLLEVDGTNGIVKILEKA
jgi:rifampicin phosphotransferase